MGSVNKVILVGNLGKDADLRYTPNGAAVSKFSLATTEVWNDKSGQRQERTEWHNIDVWGKQAESLKEYLTKGKQIYVEGRLQSRKVGRCRACDGFFPDRDFKAGSRESMRCPKCSHEAPPYIETRYDVRADRITLIGGRGQATDRGGDNIGGGHPVPAEVSEPLTDDDIPF